MLANGMDAATVMEITGLSARPDQKDMVVDFSAKVAEARAILEKAGFCPHCDFVQGQQFKDVQLSGREVRIRHQRSIYFIRPSKA